MDCPPLDPIPIVVHVGAFRLQHEATATRALWIVDETESRPAEWWSAGQVTFENRSQERRRIRYRRRVRVPLPEDVQLQGWTQECYKGGTLALTCVVVLDPGETRMVQLEATSTHNTRAIRTQ